MKILYACDLHGDVNLYRGLFELAVRFGADQIVLGGDLLPFHGPLYAVPVEQRVFIDVYLEPALREFTVRNPRASVYVLHGNADLRSSLDALYGLEREGLVRLLHGRNHQLGTEYEMIGYGNVNPTPYAVKDGERRDYCADNPKQCQAAGFLSNGSTMASIDLEDYFRKTKSIEAELSELPQPVAWNKTVYVMHAPPAGTCLDLIFDRSSGGSRAVRDFIVASQPYLTLHGHIHEAPTIGGKYLEKIGSTICINPGQSRKELYAVTFELEDVLGTIRHTVFGRI